jgi:hypothetical protein
MAAHWERWVDQPLPILGNRTPMDAVNDPDGREVVESLVIQAERLGRSATLPTDEDVYRRLRERLGSRKPRCCPKVCWNLSGAISGKVESI